MEMFLSSDDLIRVMDLFETGVVICRCLGSRPAKHSNPAFEQLLQRDADRRQIEQTLTEMLEELCPSSENGASGDTVGEALTREVRTNRASYRLIGSRIGTREEEAAAALIAVEALAIDPLQKDVLRRRFGLTQREAELTRLLVSGKTNAEVAEALEISPSTAHHYTERVLLKLGVRNRTEVGAKLLLNAPAG